MGESTTTVWGTATGGASDDVVTWWPAHDGTYPYPYTPQPYVWPAVTPTVTITHDDTIDVTLAEVEALKRAAEADEEVRAVLKRLAHRLSVTVEF